MSKLDRIEKDFGNRIHLGPRETGVLVGQKEFLLLVRAVRQLGPQLRHIADCAGIMTNGDDNCDCYEGLIDPDVLELLDESTRSQDLGQTRPRQIEEENRKGRQR